MESIQPPRQHTYMPLGAQNRPKPFSKIFENFQKSTSGAKIAPKLFSFREVLAPILEPIQPPGYRSPEALGAKSSKSKKHNQSSKKNTHTSMNKDLGQGLGQDLGQDLGQNLGQDLGRDLRQRISNCAKIKNFHVCDQNAY